MPKENEKLITIGRIEEKLHEAGFVTIIDQGGDGIIQLKYPGISGYRHTMLGPKDRNASIDDQYRMLESISDIAARLRRDSF